MPSYEYKVVPAPRRGVKVSGVKGTEARFAHALQEVMNAMGREGWEYQRTDTLPCEERVGFTGRTTTFQNMLVFRRTVEKADAGLQPRLITDSVPVFAPQARRATPSLTASADHAPAPSVRPAPVAGVTKPETAQGAEAGSKSSGVAAE